MHKIHIIKSTSYKIKSFSKLKIFLAQSYNGIWQETKKHSYKKEHENSILSEATYKDYKHLISLIRIQRTSKIYL